MKQRKTTKYVNDMADYVEDKYQPYANGKYVKSQNSDFIKKIKCDNNNLNINGDNTADFNIGNHGQAIPPVNTATKDGDLANSHDVYDSERNNKGFNNNSKFDPDCGINNENNNNVQVGQGQVE